MEPILIFITIRRFFELLLTCVAISAGITGLYVSEVLVTQDALGAGLIIGLIVFVLVNIPMLRGCYFEFEDNSLYFQVNLTAYACFFATCFAVYHFGSNVWFTWMFAVTKFAKYSNLTVSTFGSALLFHAVGLMMVLFAPLGMSWVFLQDDEADLIEPETDEPMEQEGPFSLVQEENLCYSCVLGIPPGEVDESIEECPYIDYCVNGDCAFYEPVELMKRPLIGKLFDVFSRD